MSLNTLEGKPGEAAGCRVGIVVSRWHPSITSSLLEGALETLRQHGVKEEDIYVARCPGSYEIPLAAGRLLEHTDGVIALGAVIRGETPHFDYVCEAVNRGIARLNTERNKPVAFGVLTTETVRQAQERSDSEGEKGNKGEEAGLALLEMLSLLKRMDDIKS